MQRQSARHFRADRRWAYGRTIAGRLFLRKWCAEGAGGGEGETVSETRYTASSWAGPRRRRPRFAAIALVAVAFAMFIIILGILPATAPTAHAAPASPAKSDAF